MQYVRGKLAKPQDLVILLDIVKDKTGEVRLYLPLQQIEVSICYDGKNFYLSSDDGNPKFQLTKLLEEWIKSKTQPTFEFYEEKECRKDVSLSEDELERLIQNPYLELVEEVPDTFEITKIDIERVPSFLVAHWKARKPVSKRELYRHGFTLTQIARLIDKDFLRVRPFTTAESMPVKLRTLLTVIAGIALLYLILPLNFINLTVAKVNEALNWGLRERIIGVERTRLPTKGCFNTPFILEGNLVINPGIDGKVGTGDDLKLILPEKGYTPTFTVPVK